MLKCELSCVLSGLYPKTFEVKDIFDAIEVAISEINEMVHEHDFNVDSCTISTAAYWKNVLQFRIDIELGGTTLHRRYDYDITANLRIIKAEDE